MMSWLEGRLPKWGPFGGGSIAVLEREETPEPEMIPDNSPQLMVLVNDASGFACFKTHTFPNAEAATEFILYWFRHDNDGYSAFWAMKEEPSRENPLAAALAEPLVIIHEAQKTDLVYSFSFVDIESAQGFVRDEVANGTDPAQIALYWALSVRLTTDANGTTILTPSVPAGAEREVDTEVRPLADLYERIENASSIPETADEPAALSESPAIVEAFEAVADEPAAELVCEDVVVGDTAVDVVVGDAVVEAINEDDDVAQSLIEAAAAEPAEAPAEVEVERPQADVQSIAPSPEIEDDGRAAEDHERSSGYENGFISLEPFDIVVHTN